MAAKFDFKGTLPDIIRHSVRRYCKYCISYPELNARISWRRGKRWQRQSGAIFPHNPSSSLNSTASGAGPEGCR